MKISDFDNVNLVYTCINNASISWHSVKFPEFQAFTHAVQRLIRAVGQLDEDDYWFKLIGSVRRFRFAAIAAPLTEDYLQENLRKLISHLESDKDRFSYSHPNASSDFAQLLTMAKRLTNVNVSGILSDLARIVSSLENQNQTAVLVCATRFVQDSEKGLSSIGLGNIEVISQSYLRNNIYFSNMIIIGPTRWYRNYVLSAPRAQNITILKYAWISDRWKHEYVFLEPLKQDTSKLMQSSIVEPIGQWSLEAEDVLPPTFDFHIVEKKVIEENRAHNEVDLVQAKMFLLEEDWIVLLEADETSTLTVLDLTDSKSPIKKVHANLAEPGMFVLLRTTGGGDFIVPVADQIMGASGIEARRHQRNWKSQLRSRVIAEGFERVINELGKLGSTRANPANLRHWMSERSIKTEFRDDFEAIMDFLHLHTESTLYWNLMKKIDHAHRKAGHRIRKMLLEKVRNSDLKLLKRTGKMDFILEGEESIGISAFQIKDISPQTVQVLPGQLGNPIKQTD